MLLKIKKMMDIKQVLLQWFINVLIRSLLPAKKSASSEILPYQEIAEKLRKPIIKNLKVHSSFIDNIWSANLVSMQSISKFNKGIYFLCVIDIFSKHAWPVLLKDKKGIKITNDFQTFLDYSVANQAKYGWINGVSFALNQWKNGCRIMK